MLVRFLRGNSENKWTQIAAVGVGGFELGFWCAMKSSCQIFLPRCLLKYELKQWLGPL